MDHKDNGEPWKVTDYTVRPVGGPGIASDRWETFIIPPALHSSEAALARIVSCVNACEGIADPAEAIQAAKEVAAYCEAYMEEFKGLEPMFRKLIGALWSKG